MLIGHKKQWDFLEKKFELNQLSHAYLFTGPKEIGKKLFAKEFAKLISCLGEKKPCQKCANCLMIEKGNFPDFKIVAKKEDKNEIEISQIREIQNFLSYKSYYGSFKVVIVDDADKMNQESQSCFLKTLEEPKGKTFLILISSRPDMLLPTIFSRCQTVKFFRPNDLPANSERAQKEKEILEKLVPVMNSTLADKFKYVKDMDLDKQDPLEIVEVMQKHFRKKMMDDFSDKKVKKFLELSEEISNKLIFTNANPKLALEILLMEI